MKQKNNLTEIAKMLLEPGFDRVLVACHRSPDGDAVGSSHALAFALRKMGKQARVFCSDSFGQEFSYLTKAEEGLFPFEAEHFVTVDVAAPEMLPGADFLDRISLVLDHHRINTVEGKVKCVLPEKASCGEIILKLLQEMGVEFDSYLASALYTAIATDTGCFRYANVTPETHRIAAKLMECGANAAEINVKMFETKTRTYAALERLALDGMQFFYDGKCALITITREMFAESGSDENECDGIAAISRQIEGVLVGVTMRERRDGTYKASVRTHNPVDASAICARLGGGGHHNAAGCQLPGTREEATKLLIDTIGEFI
ncbi:MAG: bifunctional oligoribonuclease/PAP phosphatase NrnA [Clostridia bacterium]|nr:bifunctional oligoribonuclease/PAP phosphatase NrnA [Clostridia bacterium]